MESLVLVTGLTTLGLGGAMTLFAWNVMRQNRRQEAARVQLLSTLTFPDRSRIDNSGPEASFQVDEFEADQFRREAEPGPAVAVATNGLFAEPEKSGASSRRTLALAVVFLAMAAIVGAYRLLHGTTAAVPSEGATVTTMSVAPKPEAAVASHDARVELLQLDHHVTANGLIVTGRVRNPSEGAPLHNVVAVVIIKDDAGRSLTTVSVPVLDPVLDAGESSEFSATAVKAANMSGYSVRFDSRERESIPQINRRPAETTPRSQ